MNNPEFEERINNVKAKIEKLIENGHLEEAESVLSEIETRMPGDPDICSMRAVIYILRGSLEEAEAILCEGLQIDSVQFDLLYNLAYIREQQGHYQQAADLYSMAATVAYSDEQKQNTDDSLERLRKVDTNIEITEKAKIVFFVKSGLDSFLGDIINDLSDKYWVRKIIVSDFKQIDAGMEWADICWFEWCDELIVYGSRLPLAKEKKIVCRLHRYEVFTDSPSKVIWGNVDKLIIVTGHLKELLETNFPGISNQVDIVIIENGVDVDKYGFTKRANGFNIAMVGYIHSRKNPVMALQIIEKLVKVDKRYKLYVAGQFQEEIIKLYWDYQLKRMRIEDNVIFEGWQNDISSWLEDKNYLLSTSIHESFGYGIAEAMARGIKPVIHDFLYANEIWSEDLLFNTVDEAVDSIINGQYESERYRTFIEERYSLKKQMMQINRLIEELLSFKNLIGKVKDILSGTVKPQELMLEDITVLIPSYNRAKLLKEDLDKGFKLGSQPKVIVDDCSTEETEWLEIINRDLPSYKSRLIINENNSGVAESRRRGLEAIETKYTTFIDDDNMMLCLDRAALDQDISRLANDVSVIVPRYIINYYSDRLFLGYDRQCYNNLSGAQVLKNMAFSGEMMGLLTGGAIAETQWMSKYAYCPLFKASEDYVMLAKMLASKPESKVITTEALVFVRRFLDGGLTMNPNPLKLMLALIAQAIACYYCVKLDIANKDEVLRWMKDRAALIQKVYNFGESFETELIAYLTGEISEEVFIHFISLYGLKLENSLDELAPELRMMRAMLYKEPKAEKWFTGMKDLPLVSIIIPTFNRRDMLKRAIDQVLKQDYPNIEIIVTDNCSEDGTEEMVRSNYKNEKRVIYHRNETNIGPAMNFRNAFYNLSSGEYCIGLCDDDYFIDSSYISSAVKLFLENPNAAFVYSGIYYNNIINNQVYRVKPDMPDIVDGMDFFINFTTEKYPNMPNPSSLIFKKANALKAKAFNGSPILLSSDLFFELRLLLTGDACFYDGIVLVYNLHEGSISRNTDLCTVDKSIDDTVKAVETAKADINELINIISYAEKEKDIDNKLVDRWLTYRIWKYMYWRINETACSIEECKALTEFLYQEHPGIYNSLKHVAARRFGKDIF